MVPNWNSQWQKIPSFEAKIKAENCKSQNAIHFASNLPDNIKGILPFSFTYIQHR